MENNNNRKVVWNACYGGFSLSREGIKRYYELKYPGLKLYYYVYTLSSIGAGGSCTYERVDENCEDHFVVTLTKDFGDKFTVTRENTKEFNDHFVSNSEFERHDPFLVRTVEELGDKASGDCAKLKVIDIGTEKYHIDEYDGYESVITKLGDDYWL